MKKCYEREKIQINHIEAYQIFYAVEEETRSVKSSKNETQVTLYYLLRQTAKYVTERSVAYRMWTRHVESMQLAKPSDLTKQHAYLL